MLGFKPYKAGHLRALCPQDAQRRDYAIMVREGHAEMLERGLSMSAWDGSTCVAVAGLMPVLPHRAAAWAVLSNRAEPYMLSITRKMRLMITQAPYRRVEMTVDAEFKNGQRLALLVGMVLDTPKPLEAYGANGEDELMYSRVTTWGP